MTDQERERVLQAVKPKLNGACPNCGSRSWTLGNVAMSPELGLDSNVVSVGGPGIPTISVVCRQCSLVQFFAAVPLGLFPPADLTSSVKQ